MNSWKEKDSYLEGLCDIDTRVVIMTTKQPEVPSMIMFDLSRAICCWIHENTKPTILTIYSEITNLYMCVLLLLHWSE